MAKKSRKAKTPAKTKKTSKKAPKRVKRSAKRPARRTVTTSRADALLAPIKGATSREIGTVKLDVVTAGAARVKRMIYPPGFRWSKAMQPIVRTDRCMHAHVGFIARGEIHIEYADGCVVEYQAPQVVAIDPGHDGWVVGREPVVMIEFDFEGETIDKLGMPTRHGH